MTMLVTCGPDEETPTHRDLAFRFMSWQRVPGRLVETRRPRVTPPVTKGTVMPRGIGIYDDENRDEPKGGRPGPTDQGREGGMSTREIAPDVAETDQEPTA